MARSARQLANDKRLGAAQKKKKRERLAKEKLAAGSGKKFNVARSKNRRKRAKQLGPKEEPAARKARRVAEKATKKASPTQKSLIAKARREGAAAARKRDAARRAPAKKRGTTVATAASRKPARRKRAKARKVDNRKWRRAGRRTVTVQVFRKGRAKRSVTTSVFKANPTGNWKNTFVLGFGVAGGITLATLIDRFVATRTPENGLHPWYGQDAVARQMAAPDGMRMGVVAASSIATMGVAGLLSKKMPTTAYAVAGVAIGMGGFLINQAIMFFLLPKVSPVLLGNEMNIGNRLYPLEQKTPQEALTKLLEAENAPNSPYGGRLDPLPVDYLYSKAKVPTPVGLGRARGNQPGVQGAPLVWGNQARPQMGQGVQGHAQQNFEPVATQPVGRPQQAGMAGKQPGVGCGGGCGGAKAPGVGCGCNKPMPFAVDDPNNPLYNDPNYPGWNSPADPSMPTDPTSFPADVRQQSAFIAGAPAQGMAQGMTQGMAPTPALPPKQSSPDSFAFGTGTEADINAAYA